MANSKKRSTRINRVRKRITELRKSEIPIHWKDAADFSFIISELEKGDFVSARNIYRPMDTDAREDFVEAYTLGYSDEVAIVDAEKIFDLQIGRNS